MGYRVDLKLYFTQYSYFNLQAYITGVKTNDKVDGVAEVEFSFEADGEVTFVGGN